MDEEGGREDSMSFKFKDLETKKMKLADMKPAEYNPRKISVRALEGLGKSMERFGNLVPIVWNKRSGNIVGGHQRYRKLMDAGATETDVVVVDLDGNEEMALNIALNSKELRGDFTSEVVKQLELCEVRLGDVFGEVGLMDLYNFVRRIKFDDAPPGNRPNGDGGSDDGSGAGTGDSGKPNDVIPTGPDAVIMCPRCRSSFKLKDNAVVFDTVKAAKEAKEAKAAKGGKQDA
jgi:hypothetical protein